MFSCIKTSVKCFFYLVLVAAMIVFAPTASAQLSPAFSGLNATANDATTAYLNPAGLTRIPNTQIVGIATFAYTVSEFEVKPGTTVSGGNPDNDDGFLLIPSFYLSKPLGEDLRFGFALNIPTGLGSDYGDTWAGRYTATKSSLVFVNFSPVLAYRINNRFSIG